MLLVVVGYIVAVQELSEAVHGLAMFMRSKACLPMMLGIGILLCYSRLYGSDMLWSMIIPPEEEPILHTIRRISEESLEILGIPLSYSLRCSTAGTDSP